MPQKTHQRDSKMFPNWEHFIPNLGIFCSQAGNKFQCTRTNKPYTLFSIILKNSSLSLKHLELSIIIPIFAKQKIYVEL